MLHVFLTSWHGRSAKSRNELAHANKFASKIDFPKQQDKNMFNMNSHFPLQGQTTRFQNLLSELSVLAEEVQNYEAREDFESIARALDEALPRARTIQQLHSTDPAVRQANPYALKGLFTSMFEFLRRTSAQQPIREQYLRFMANLLREAYPGYDYHSLDVRNKLHQLLRRERVGVQEYELYESYHFKPAFPVEEDELERFYKKDRHAVLRAMQEIGAAGWSTDPFERDMSAKEFFEGQRKLLAFSLEEKPA